MGHNLPSEYFYDTNTNEDTIMNYDVDEKIIYAFGA